MVPVWYTLFYEYYRYGTPVIQPLIMQFQDQDIKIENQFMVGSIFMIRPVDQPRLQYLEVFFPLNSQWYDFYTFQHID